MLPLLSTLCLGIKAKKQTENSNFHNSGTEQTPASIYALRVFRFTYSYLCY